MKMVTQVKTSWRLCKAGQTGVGLRKLNVNHMAVELQGALR